MCVLFECICSMFCVCPVLVSFQFSTLYCVWLRTGSLQKEDGAPQQKLHMYSDKATRLTKTYQPEKLRMTIVKQLAEINQLHRLLLRYLRNALHFAVMQRLDNNWYTYLFQNLTFNKTFLFRIPKRCHRPQSAGSKFKNSTPTFPRRGVGWFGYSVGYWGLSLFRLID